MTTFIALIKMRNYHNISKHIQGSRMKHFISCIRFIQRKLKKYILNIIRILPTEWLATVEGEQVKYFLIFFEFSFLKIMQIFYSENLQKHL